tara:strand:- start:953 stop:1588 length:636 start_codon:yes stop_codon:yes gene_type:complete
MATSLADLDDLRELIQDTLNRSDLSASVDNWIALARIDINSRIKVAAQETTASVAITAGSTTSPLPSAYGELRTMTYEVDQNDIRELFLGPISPITTDQMSANPGYPRYFAVTGDTFLWDQIPDASWTATCLYYKAVPEFDFSDGTDTNWIMTAYPNVLLYGSLMSALAKIGNDVRAGIWRTFYTEAFENMMDDDKAKRWNGIPRMRSGLT